MNEWQERFARQMNKIREQSAGRFQKFSDDVLEPVFNDLSEFVAQWDMRATEPQNQNDRRTFKFALTEDAYVLLNFRLHGVEAVECGYECWIPGIGRQPGGHAHMNLSEADRSWAESFFQACLDHLASQYSEKHGSEKKDQAEPALA
jgi:hypothetical protein